MRYFFNYRNAGQYFADSEGTDLESLVAATAEGRQSASELLGTERGEQYPEFCNASYEIADQTGAVLSIMRFVEPDGRQPEAPGAPGGQVERPDLADPSRLPVGDGAREALDAP